MDDYFSKYCGITVEKAEKGESLLWVDVRQDLMNDHGSMHGGMLFTLVDHTAGVAVRSSERGMRPCVTLNANIYYLRPATSGRIYGEGKLIKEGKTTALVEVSVKDEKGKLLCRSQVEFYYT